MPFICTSLLRVGLQSTLLNVGETAMKVTGSRSLSSADRQAHNCSAKKQGGGKRHRRCVPDVRRNRASPGPVPHTRSQEVRAQCALCEGHLVRRGGSPTSPVRGGSEAQGKEGRKRQAKVKGAFTTARWTPASMARQCPSKNQWVGAFPRS